MDSAFDFVAFQPSRNRLSDPERHEPGAMDETPAPDAPAVDGDGHDRQAQRAVKGGESRLQRGALSAPHPRPLRIDEHRSSRRDRLASFLNQGAERAGARAPLD